MNVIQSLNITNDRVFNVIRKCPTNIEQIALPMNSHTQDVPKLCGKMFPDQFYKAIDYYNDNLNPNVNLNGN